MGYQDQEQVIPNLLKKIESLEKQITELKLQIAKYEEILNKEKENDERKNT